MEHHVKRRPLLPIWFTIPLYVVVSFLFIGLSHSLLLTLYGILPIDKTVNASLFLELITYLVSLAVVWGVAALFLKYLNRRPVSELGLQLKGRWKECIMGFLFAVVLYSIAFSLSLLLGVVQIEDIQCNIGILIGSLFIFLVAATMEEVMARGYMQGQLMNTMGKFSSMVIASLIFSAMHIFNPNIALLPLINLFLAGLLLGASYMYTRNLAFPIFLHTAWNWIQGPVLGYEVSGNSMFPSLIHLNFPEKNVWNGGDFGFEGSVICTILLIVATVCIIGWYERKLKKSKA